MVIKSKGSNFNLDASGLNVRFSSILKLKILATGDNKKTISAIQIPTNSKRRQSDGGNASEPVKSSWTENEVHAGFQLFQ